MKLKLLFLFTIPILLWTISICTAETSIANMKCKQGVECNARIISEQPKSIENEVLPYYPFYMHI